MYKKFTRVPSKFSMKREIEFSFQMPKNKKKDCGFEIQTIFKYFYNNILQNILKENWA